MFILLPGQSLHPLRITLCIIYALQSAFWISFSILDIKPKFSKIDFHSQMEAIHKHFVISF